MLPIHAIHLVEVDYEALFIRVVQLDTLPVEYYLVVRVLEMLHELYVLHAELFKHKTLVFAVKEEVAVTQLLIFLDHLEHNVNFKRQCLDGVKLLD